MKELWFNKLDSSDKNVSKFIFASDYLGEKKDICVESVLYKYPTFEERTVLCISTQCGCPVGCTFCGTGKHFVRNLTPHEILRQANDILNSIKIDPKKIKKLQIMFMSMGEPFLNYKNVDFSISCLHKFYPNAQLLISTSSPNPAIKENFDAFIQLSKEI